MNENETDQAAAMATTVSHLAIILPRDFPTDVSKWMKINASPKMALKLMQCCKYFKHSNGFPFLVVKNVNRYLDHWRLHTLDDQKVVTDDLHTIPKELWITNSIELEISSNLFSTLLLKTAIFDVRKIDFVNQQLTINEFKILNNGGNVESFLMTSTVIRDDMGKIVPFENICECLPNARKIGIRSNSLFINSLKAAETKISSKLESLILGFEPENFDLQKFLAYMKSHQKISYSLTFYGISKRNYNQTFAPSVEKVLQGWSPEYHPPKISVEKRLIFVTIRIID